MQPSQNPFSALRPDCFRPRNAKSEQEQLRSYYKLPIARKTELSQRTDKLIAADLRREDAAFFRQSQAPGDFDDPDELKMLPESFRPHKHEGPREFISRIRKVSQIEVQVSMKQAEIYRLNRNAIQREAQLVQREQQIRELESVEECRLRRRDEDLTQISGQAQRSSVSYEQCKQQIEVMTNVVNGVLMEVQRELQQLQVHISARDLILAVAEIGSTSGQAAECLQAQRAIEAWFHRKCDGQSAVDYPYSGQAGMALKFAAKTDKGLQEVSEKKRAQSAGGSSRIDVFRLLKAEPVLELARTKYHLDDRERSAIDFDFRDYVKAFEGYAGLNGITFPRLYGPQPLANASEQQTQPLNVFQIPSLSVSQLKNNLGASQATSNTISRSSSRLSNDMLPSSRTIAALKTSRHPPKPKTQKPPKLETSKQAEPEVKCEGPEELATGLFSDAQHLLFEKLDVGQEQVDFRISQAIIALRYSANLNIIRIFALPADFCMNISLLEQSNLVRTQNIQNMTLYIDQCKYDLTTQALQCLEVEESLRATRNEIQQKIADFKSTYVKNFSQYQHTVEAFIYDFSSFKEPDEIKLDRLETELLLIDVALIYMGVNARLIQKFDLTVGSKSIMTQFEKLMNAIEQQYLGCSQQTKDMARRELGKRRREETRAAKAREFQMAGLVNEEKAKLREQRMKREQVKARKVVSKCYVGEKHKTLAQLDLEQQLKLGQDVNVDEQDFYV